MSAICGLIGSQVRQPDSEQHLLTMLTTLRDRGPESPSTHIDRERQVMLGFRFLQTQPGESSPAITCNEDRSMMMVCDGHVFNHRELRGWLADRGHSCTGPHSSELLLHLYEEEGVTGWRRVDGQFAVAIWDLRRGHVVLGRDFLGVRSIYYRHGPSGIGFASAIKALLHGPQSERSVDETALSHFLTFTSVPGHRTLFNGISKLPPGSAAVCTQEGTTALTRYWDLLENPIAEDHDERFYIDRVRALHAESLCRRAVPGALGSLLSGGNDSSANAALLARNESRPLHTFTVGLAGLEGQDKYNDMEYARRVARVIQSEHHEALLTTDEFLNTIPVTIDAMEDLVSEPSSVFLYHALRLAKEQGVSVVITGEANDELCCGHPGMLGIRNGYYRWWHSYMDKPHWLRQMIGMVGPVVSPKHRDILRRAAAGEEYFWTYEIGWTETEKSSVMAGGLPGHHDSASHLVKVCRERFNQSGHRGRDYLFYIIYAMMQDFYFTNLMLGKLDSLAAALGLEARCPYTAPEYAHFVFNVPVDLKSRDGLVKYFFKKAIEGVLPDEIIYRPKQGFRTPVVELFRGTLGKWAEPVLLETGLTRAGLLRKTHLADLLSKHRRGDGDYANRLWTAMTLNLWHERWITGARA